MRYPAYLLLAVCVSGCSPTQPAPEATATIESTAETGGSDETESTSEAAASEGDSVAAVPAEEMLIIDVRSQQEWDSGHFAGAIHIPHTEIAEKISEHTNDKNAKILVYCAVGGRAGKAKEALEQLGFVNVENGGGLEDVQQRFAAP